MMLPTPPIDHHPNTRKRDRDTFEQSVTGDASSDARKMQRRAEGASPHAFFEQPAMVTLVAEELFYAASVKDVASFSNAARVTRQATFDAAEHIEHLAARAGWRQARRRAQGLKEPVPLSLRQATKTAQAFQRTVRCPDQTIGEWADEQANGDVVKATALRTKLDDVRKQMSKEIDFSSLRLTSLLSGIGRFVSLTAIDLSDNRLPSVPNSLKRLVNLRELDLSNNRLRHWPNFVALLQRLESLDVSENKIESVDKSVGRLKQLRVLSVAYNHITSIDEAIGECEKLEQMECGNNPLVQLPDTLHQLSMLSVFSAEYCGLRALPSRFGESPQLRTLSIEQNELKRLPLSVLQSATVEDLFVQGNPLRNGALQCREMTTLLSLHIDVTQQGAVDGLADQSYIRFHDAASNEPVTAHVADVRPLLWTHYPPVFSWSALLSDPQ